MTDCGPRQLMIETGRHFPDAWRLAEDMRAKRGNELPDWPTWCFRPLAGWYAITTRHFGVEKLDINTVQRVSILGAIGTWRMTQGIYRFDPTLYEEIVTTPVDGDLPCEVLYHLPEWCVYIETPGMDQIHGFFAHLECDANTARHELRLLMDYETATVAVPIHIGPWTLPEAVARMINETKRQGAPQAMSQYADEIAKRTEPFLSLLLYLCSASAEIGAGDPPKNPSPAKTKKGWRIFSPSQPEIWDVGLRIGAALRKAYEQEGAAAADTIPGHHARPRAHIRRAHWHTYRIGEKRAGVTLKWLPPIPINVERPDDMPASIRKVQKDRREK